MLSGGIKFGLFCKVGARCERGWDSTLIEENCSEIGSEYTLLLK
jgi:hypothetical protein